MYKFLCVILFLLVFIIDGCSTIQGLPDAPRPKSVAQSDPAYLINPADLKKYNDENDIEKKKKIRNEIIDERLLEIDNQFGEFEKNLWRQGVGSGIGTDWVQLTIAGLTATIGGETTKAALGAAQTAIVGGKASFDKHAYMEKTLPVLMAQMVAERDTILAEIEKNKQMSIGQYSLYGALSDLKKYIRAGSIPGVIQAIAKEAGAKAKKANDDIKNIRTEKYVKDEAGDKIRAFWKPDGKTVDKTNEAALKKWMTAKGLLTGPGTITMFIRGEAMSDLRLQAVRELIEN